MPCYHFGKQWSMQVKTRIVATGFLVTGISFMRITTTTGTWLHIPSPNNA